MSTGQLNSTKYELYQVTTSKGGSTRIKANGRNLFYNTDEDGKLNVIDVGVGLNGKQEGYVYATSNKDRASSLAKVTKVDGEWQIDDNKGTMYKDSDVLEHRSLNILENSQSYNIKNE